LNRFRQSWAAQRRVLGALVMRDIQTRWGRRNLGFAWLFLEPLVFAFPVLTMWSMMRPSHDHGIPVIAFLWSGYLPLLLFRHVTALAMYSVRTNGALMYHRAVQPLDLVVARCGLEVIGNLAAIFSSFMIFYALGLVEWPQNVPLLLLGVFYMAWWSCAVCLVVAGLSERTDLVEHIWPPFSYIYMPISGFFYLAAWLPPSLREVALTVLPSLHSYEMIRSGLFGGQIQAFYDIQYVTTYLAILTLFGLWLVRNVREYIEF
jgi:capsular polysaccharide transport system permease protein